MQRDHVALVLHVKRRGQVAGRQPLRVVSKRESAWGQHGAMVRPGRLSRMHVIVPWIHHGEDGWSPDLPEDLPGYLVMFSLRRAIAVVDVSCDDPAMLRPFAASDELSALLESVRRYAPAFARARHRAENMPSTTSPVAFLRRLGVILAEELERQPTDRATLVRTRVDELGYRSKGEFVWALKLSPDGTRLTWATDDGCWYTDDAAGFDIPEHVRLRLLGREMRASPLEPGLPMYLVEIHAVPLDPTDVQEFGGAYVNCWIESPSLGEAVSRAMAEVEGAGWRPDEVRRAHLTTRESYTGDDDGLEYYEQALIDQEVFVFYTYPIEDEDHEEDDEK